MSNTPYRMHKAREHEGGIITPMVVSWPAGLKHPGKRVSATAHINDLMPTCLELAGATYPDSYDGVTLDPLDGESILPLLRGERRPGIPTYYWEHEGNRAVRQGDWKLVALHKGEWELYNLKLDPVELDNQIASNPDKALELRALYQSWANQHGVQSWPLKH